MHVAFTFDHYHILIFNIHDCLHINSHEFLTSQFIVGLKEILRIFIHLAPHPLIDNWSHGILTISAKINEITLHPNF